MPLPTADRWVASWAASPCGFSGALCGPESTIRQTMRLSAGGRAIRLRFVNPHAYQPLQFGAVTVGLAADSSPALRSAPTAVSVGGRTSFTVQPGEVVLTDPISLVVGDLETIAVSAYCVEPVPMSTHDWANRLLWGTLSNLGDRTADQGGSLFRPIGFSWVWVDAVEVLAPDAMGVVVAIGDSITDGAGSDFDTDTRWPDILAERFAGLPAGDPRRRAVANAGIGGNTVAGLGTSAVGVNVVSRLDRDALSLAGVTEVLLFAGSNDLYLGGRADDLVVHLASLAERIRGAGARAIIATVIPRVGGYLWTETAELRRHEVNAWIRTQSVFDCVIDFESALDDPDAPGRMRAEFDADGTHPNSAGYRALAECIDLDLFDAASTRVQPPKTPTPAGEERAR